VAIATVDWRAGELERTAAHVPRRLLVEVVLGFVERVHALEELG
jgi:hypothetical protein